MKIEIVPKDIVKIQTVVSIELKITSFVLNESVSISAFLRDATGGLVDIKNVKLEGEEYHQWGENDNYITSLILEKLEVEKKE